ncbi:hypothetical protein LRB59_00580 [Borreliella burgdorferi]|uniref:hypothetical protein n=1 Tax=Borreliella burgdorferi TaxID=139 RepID=UPI00016B3763|nr:hypothetical protein [Borreliella burgdorferi]EEC21574.1 conserved hypothetical protein [Borreliella burgdorferi 156a]MCD2330586.1 hypothetical protein [Borreliella burgdorferi]MCD2407912.1 hypothetical protein [Borreliella burgdorferi]MCR8909663.1 hypothetical protein [Borreliella burgdorferi 297]MDK7383671.1 hypothetical protein [Borreliella burgdorferi]
MKKTPNTCIFLTLLIISNLNALANEEGNTNKKNAQPKQISNFFSPERGFTYSTGIGIGVGFFLNSNIKHLIFRPYYTFSNNTFDFLIVAMILTRESLNIPKKMQYFKSYIGGGINWHIANLIKKTKYFSATIGIGGRFYLSTNFIEDIRFYEKLPYVIEPYMFIEISSKKAIPLMGLDFKIDFLFLDTFNISFNFTIRYNFKDKNEMET